MEGQNEPAVIDLEYASTSVSSPQAVTMQILFGTIPTIVTTSVASLKHADKVNEGHNMVNEHE